MTRKRLRSGKLRLSVAPLDRHISFGGGDINTVQESGAVQLKARLPHVSILDTDGTKPLRKRSVQPVARDPMQEHRNQMIKKPQTVSMFGSNGFRTAKSSITPSHINTRTH